MKVFTSLFPKSDRQSNARSVGRRAHAAKSFLQRFFFAKLFSCASCAKEKSGQRIKIAFVSSGEPPTCVVPLCQAPGLAFTLLWRFE